MRNFATLKKLRYLIEPISICSYFLLAFINTILTEYIFQRYSHDIGYDFSLSISSTSSNCGNVTNSTQFDLLQKVCCLFTWETKLSRVIQKSVSYGYYTRSKSLGSHQKCSLEAATRGVLRKNVFLEIPQNSQ